MQVAVSMNSTSRTRPFFLNVGVSRLRIVLANRASHIWILIVLFGDQLLSIMTSEKISPLDIPRCLDISFGIQASCDKGENAVWQRDDIVGLARCRLETWFSFLLLMFKPSLCPRGCVPPPYGGGTHPRSSSLG